MYKKLFYMICIGLFALAFFYKPPETTPILPAPNVENEFLLGAMNTEYMMTINTLVS